MADKDILGYEKALEERLSSIDSTCSSALSDVERSSSEKKPLARFQGRVREASSILRKDIRHRENFQFDGIDDFALPFACQALEKACSALERSFGSNDSSLECRRIVERLIEDTRATLDEAYVKMSI